MLLYEGKIMSKRKSKTTKKKDKITNSETKKNEVVNPETKEEEAQPANSNSKRKARDIIKKKMDEAEASLKEKWESVGSRIKQRIDNTEDSFIPSKLKHRFPSEKAPLTQAMDIVTSLGKGDAPDALAKITQLFDIIEENKIDLNQSHKANKKTLLTAAVQKGNLDLVAGLITKNANINIIDEAGLSPITLAALNKDLKMIHLLIQNENLQINAPNGFGLNATGIARQQYSTDENDAEQIRIDEAIFKLLTKNKGKVTELNSKNLKKNSQLFDAKIVNMNMSANELFIENIVGPKERIKKRDKLLKTLSQANKLDFLNLNVSDGVNTTEEIVTKSGHKLRKSFYIKDKVTNHHRVGLEQNQSEEPEKLLPIAHFTTNRSQPTIVSASNSDDNGNKYFLKATHKRSLSEGNLPEQKDEFKQEDSEESLDHVHVINLQEDATDQNYNETSDSSLTGEDSDISL